MQMSLRKFLIAGLAIVLAFAVFGCTGDDGDRGPQGIEGPPGEQGEPGVVLEDVVPINPVLDLTQTVSYNSSNGQLSIHFFLFNPGEDLDDPSDDVGIDVTKDAYEMRVYVSELIPTDPLDVDNPGPAWNQLFNERGTPAAGSPMPGTLTLVDAATGEYTYVCDNALVATTNVIRVTVRARWREDINEVRVVFANPVNASYDFLESDPGTRLASSGADMVTTAACESCHGARIGDVGHGGGYTQVKTCNHCHNVNFMATRDLEADLAFMVHRIHDAGVFTELGDFSEVTYPQHIYTCAKCHDGPEAGLAYSNPTRSNCGSCHASVDFATGTGHDGGAQANDSACDNCHPATGAINPPLIFPVQTVHDVQPTLANTPEFDVTITMTDPANGQFYEVGEAPVVTVTLATGAGPVAGTVYTANQDGEGVDDVTEGLSTANLYVYGPRNEAVPVLTNGSTTDPLWNTTTPPKQSHNLFLADIDGVPNPELQPAPGEPGVTTSASGYSYQLWPIPAELEPGTYMVRFEGADYGGISTTDYVTSSSAVINFQVGTATVEPKVSGDACIECHGATIMHLAGSHAHHVPFDTDHCLACHDKSGNHGDYIGNRVHAVHRATITGDFNDRDWSEVTYPRPANNCITCHTNTAVDTPVWRTPSMLACGGCHGVMPDAVVSDYPVDEQVQVTREIGAAQHMEQNGGDAEADAVGAPPTLSCLICHGEGRVADLFKTHQLILFRELPVDPNE